jgi:hypothetical protein
MDTNQQIEHYRLRIKEMLKRVPPSVNGGSHGTAVAYKELASKAGKAVNASNLKLSVAIAMHTQLSQYY